MISKATLDDILPKEVNGRKGKLFLSKNCLSPENASKLYQFLKLSLLDINNWSRHKPGISINSKLLDCHGRQVGRIGQTGDRIKIILPRWQTIFRIYDWFEIFRIEERMSGNTEIFFVTLVPSTDPKEDLDPSVNYSSQQSSFTIFVIRDEHKIELQIHTQTRRIDGMKLKVNFHHLVNSLFIQDRFYKKQWGNLLKSLLNKGSANFTNLN